MVGELYMINWHLWDGSAVAWDNQLQQFADYTVYQGHAWGEHRRQFGWLPIRLVATLEGNTVAMAQVLLKRYPLGVGMAWVPGGPVGDLDAWEDRLRRAIRKAAGVSFLVCRINVMKAHVDQEGIQLEKQGWCRSTTPLLTGLSLTYQPSLSEGDRQKLCSGSWRHNLRRSSKYGLKIYVWNDPDPDQMIGIYNEMQSYKQLAEQTSRDAIESLLLVFSEQCFLVRCDDAEGNMLAFRGALLMGNKGWDTFAAATPQGRKVYASHMAFWELMQQCAARGIASYDMGGADPVNNRGVYDFKKGTGAEDIRYLGEWEHSRPKILGAIAGRLIASKRR